MRRLALLLILTLLLGLTTSIAVAWAIGGLRPEVLRAYAHPYSRASAINGWFVEEWRGIGQVTYAGNSWVHPADRSMHPPPRVPKWSRFQSAPIHEWRTVVESAFGWPIPSLRCTLAPHETGMGQTFREDISGGILLSGLSPTATMTEGWLKYRVLPLRPIWSGMLASAVFWSGAWLTLTGIIVVGGRAQEWQRRRRNRCVRCAYDLRGLKRDRCSECGWPADERLPALAHTWLAILFGLLIVSLLALPTIALTAPRGGTPAIHLAARDGDIRRVQRFLDRGIEIATSSQAKRHMNRIRRRSCGPPVPDRPTLCASSSTGARAWATIFSIGRY